MGNREVLCCNVNGAGVAASLPSKPTNRFRCRLVTEEGKIRSIPALGLGRPVGQIYFCQRSVLIMHLQNRQTTALVW